MEFNCWPRGANTSQIAFESSCSSGG